MPTLSGSSRWFRSFRSGLALTVLLLPACHAADDPPRSADGSAADGVTDSEYVQEIEAWRAERLANLTREDGWLTLTGLYWLRDGPNAVGSAVSSPVRLPRSAPDRVGLLTKSGPAVMLRLDPGVEATLEPETAARQLAESQDGRSLLLVNDLEGEPTLIRLGDVSFHLIQRDDKVGVRVRDAAASARTEFAGLESFPIDRGWSLDARFEPYDPPREIPIVNVLGQTTPNPSPGALIFEHDGNQHRLDALDAGDELFVIFGDRTNRETGDGGTYPAGRYLYVDKPADGETKVRLDFNKAYNPPCAFTEFATCPLPPPQNKLEIAVEAGETFTRDDETQTHAVDAEDGPAAGG